MPQARCNGISIEYEVCGPETGVPLLLIHGVGAQLIRWPEGLCQAFTAAGYRVIRFDNRDAGLSTHLHGDLAAASAARQRGEPVDQPYSLSDMAADAAGLLDALGIESAHVLGVSLGGMIAQLLAIDYRARVRSLTVVMSHSGNPDMPGSDPALLATLVAAPPDPAYDLEGYLRHSVALNRALGSPAYPTDEAELRSFAAKAAARTYDPAGAGRQLATSRSAPDRREGLRALDLPTLVIHGAEDRLIPPACGADIANNVRRAWLMIINGMGHDLPAELFALFVSTVNANAARAAA